MQANFVASDLQDPLGTETRPYAETRAESRTHCQSLAVMHLVIIYSEDELSRSRSLSIFCVANITFGIGLARVRPFFRQRKKFFHCPSRWVWIMRRVDIVYLLHAPCPHRDDENLFRHTILWKCAYFLAAFVSCLGEPINHSRTSQLLLARRTSCLETYETVKLVILGAPRGLLIRSRRERKNFDA